MANTIKITITGDANSYVKAAEQSAAATDKIGGAATKAATHSKSLSLAQLGTAAALVGFAKKSVDASLEGQKSQALLDTAIRNTGSSVDDYRPKVDALSQRMAHYGYENDQVEGSLARLTSATNDPQKALDLMGTTADLAAARHLSLEQAATLVGKVVNGNVGSLSRYGIATKDASGKTLTSAAALELLKTKYHGVSDEIAKTPAGKLAAFQAEFKNLEEEVGGILLPVLVKAGDVVTTVVDDFKALPGPVKDVIEVGGGLALTAVAISKGWGLASRTVGDIKSIAETAMGTVGKLSDRFGSASRSAEGLGTASQTAATETEAAAAKADTSIASVGTTAQESAAQVEAASAEADTSIASVGTTAQESAVQVETASAESAGSMAQIGVASSEAAAEVAASTAEVDGSIASIGVTATEAAAVVATATGEVDGSIATIGVASTDAAAVTDTAFVGIGAAADTLAADILAAKAASSEGQWGGGGLAPTGSFGSVAGGLAKAGGLGALAIEGGAFINTQIGTSILDPVGAQQKADSEGRNAHTDKALIKWFQDQQAATAKAAQSDVSWLDEAKSVLGVREVAKTDPTKAFTGVLQQDPKKAQSLVDALTQQDAGLNHSTAQYKDNEAQLTKWQKAINDATGSSKSHKAAAEADTAANHDNAGSFVDVATKASNYAKQLHSQTDPVFGAISANEQLQQSQLKVIAATQAVAAAKAKDGENSQEYRSALADLSSAQEDQVNSALGQQTSLANLQAAFASGASSADDMKAKLQSWVAQGLITQGEADTVIGKLGALGGAAAALNGTDAKVTVTADTTDALNKIHFLQAAIQAAARSNPNLYVTLTGHTQQSGGVSHNATGGPIRRGELSMVNELGHEMFEDTYGNQYLMPATAGTIRPHSSLEQVDAPFGAKPASEVKPEAWAQFANLPPVEHTTVVAPHVSVGAPQIRIPAPVAAPTLRPASGGPAIVFEAGSIVLQAAPGDDPYTFGQKAIAGILAFERGGAGSAWRDVPVR